MAGEGWRTPDGVSAVGAGRWHEVVDHTADARLRAWAKTLPALFEEAALALSTLTVEVDPGAPHPEWVEVEVEGHDLEHLAFAWMNELIALAELRHRAVDSADVSDLSEGGHEGTQPGWQLRSRVRLLAFDPAYVRALRQAKAATLHGLEIDRVRGGWQLAAVIDI